MLVTLLLLLTLFRLYLNPLPSQPPVVSIPSLHLDPNTAAEEDLAAVPGIGRSRARTIIEYRNTHREPNGPPLFLDLESFRVMKSFGPEALRKAGPFLTFPAAPGSATQP